MNSVMGLVMYGFIVLWGYVGVGQIMAHAYMTDDDAFLQFIKFLLLIILVFFNRK